MNHNENNQINNSQNKPLLDVRALTHNFDYPLFKDINLSLNEKETIAIIGVSGSGKSTLLNIFASLQLPNNGEVYYKDQDILKLSNNELLKIRREDFGIIFQSHYLFRGFNANENLHITELLNEVEVDQDIIKALKIDHIMNQNIGELSGGQQQRLSCARVLTKQPKIIFADEPTGNLDTQTANEVMDVLFDYIDKKNGAMIIVTHEDDIAYRCDKVYRLHEHRLEQLK